MRAYVHTSKSCVHSRDVLCSPEFNNIEFPIRIILKRYRYHKRKKTPSTMKTQKFRPFMTPLCRGVLNFLGFVTPLATWSVARYLPIITWGKTHSQALKGECENRRLKMVVSLGRRKISLVPFGIYGVSTGGHATAQKSSVGLITTTPPRKSKR